MASEDRVYFPCGDMKLEGLFRDADSDRGVVICHPNPMMGGNMYNNVVESLLTAFVAKGYSTLRFNFRGTGRSQGIHANGSGEVDDLASATDFLKNRDIRNVALAGYSFGAWVTANYLQKQHVSGPVVLISPPVSFYEFPGEVIADKVDLIVCGSRDPFCQAEDVERFATTINAKVILIPGTDHFYVGREEILTENVQKNLL
ncbi:MAG: alpha/beta fold hydrolase [Syntrophaceae bacterium]|nr:alpha/beta fold hydrolase [Syntrophaceae bacterium]